MSAEPAAIAYLARRSVAPQWRGFLHALMEALDQQMDPPAREGFLRTVGYRMGLLAPLPGCATLGELETRMNDALAAAEWGYVELALDTQDRALLLTHSAPPVLATAADPEGEWVGAVLEGLHATWLASQPGAEASLAPRRVSSGLGTVVLRYGRN